MQRYFQHAIASFSITIIKIIIFLLVNTLNALSVFWSVKPKPLIIILLQECGGQFHLFQRFQQKQAITQIKVCSTWKTSPSEQELFNLAFLNVFEFCTRERTLLLQVIAPHKKEETPSMKDGKCGLLNWACGSLNDGGISWELYCT